MNRLSDTTVEVVIRRRFSSAVRCPCRKNCGELLNVGTYGHLGGGVNGCPHCGANKDRPWNSKKDLVNHMHRTKRCLKLQGFSNNISTPTEMLGPFLVWKSNDVQYQLQQEDGKTKDGYPKFIKLFDCPGCSATMRYAYRHSHLVRQHGLTAEKVDPARHRDFNLSHLIRALGAGPAPPAQSEGESEGEDEGEDESEDENE